LRQLLGEKPGQHRFIATVPGKGYRFVASVVESSEDGTHNVNFVPSDATLPGSTSSIADTAPKTRRGHSLYLRHWLSPTLAVVLLAAAFLVWHRKNTSNVAPIRSIAVLPFKPIAGESTNEMELGIPDSLTTQLSGGNDLLVRPFS